MLRVNTKAESGSIVNSILIFVSFVSLVLIVTFGYQWWAGEERVIRARLDRLADVLSPPAGGGELAVVGRMGELRNYFAPDIRVHINGDEVVSRETLVGLIGRWKPSEEFQVEFADVVVTLGEGGTAQVSLTARLYEEDPRSGEKTVDAREASLTMRKIAGDWVLAEVESRESR